MTAPAIGIHPVPRQYRLIDADTTRFTTADVHAAREVDAPADIDPEIVGLVSRIRATLSDSRVPDAVKDGIRETLRLAAGDAVTAAQMARGQQILENPLLSTVEKFAAFAEVFAHPDWCDDCCPGDSPDSPLHIGVVGTVTDTVHGGEVTTVVVRIERDDNHGQRGQAYVRVEVVEGVGDLSPEAALRLADLHGEAARLAVQDRAEGGAL
ncbi:hypothetical protein AB0B39_23765 [Micromonospora sp. NPDC049114]|uniref:hypothetical protein n=1 Tax=Micromonospora sp. NPDC049114 TaxID=3155498 RepID=UPI0034023217